MEDSKVSEGFDEARNDGLPGGEIYRNQNSTEKQYPRHWTELVILLGCNFKIIK